MFNPTFWAVTQPLGLNNPVNNQYGSSIFYPAVFSVLSKNWTHDRVTIHLSFPGHVLARISKLPKMSRFGFVFLLFSHFLNVMAEKWFDQ